MAGRESVMNAHVLLEDPQNIGESAQVSGQQ
jgi:hypothetical protein